LVYLACGLIRHGEQARFSGRFWVSHRYGGVHSYGKSHWSEIRGSICGVLSVQPINSKNAFNCQFEPEPDVNYPSRFEFWRLLDQPQLMGSSKPSPHPRISLIKKYQKMESSAETHVN